MNDASKTPASDQEPQRQLVAGEPSSLRPPTFPDLAEARPPASAPIASVAGSSQPANAPNPQESQPQLIAPEDSFLRPPTSSEPVEARKPAEALAGLFAASSQPAHALAPQESQPQLVAQEYSSLRPPILSEPAGARKPAAAPAAFVAASPQPANASTPNEPQPQLVAPEDSSLRPPTLPEPAEARTPATIPSVPVTASSSPANPPVLLPTVEFLWKTHSYINEYIRFADTKAGFGVAIATALLGALFTAHCHERFLYVAPVQWTGIGWLGFLAFAFLLASILSAVAAVRPRLWTTASEGFLFWESITAFESPETFSGALLNQTQDAMTVQVAHHVYAISKVCRRKYFYVNLAIMLGAFGAILGGLTLLYLPKS